MKFRVLGPLKVETGDCLVPITSARQRAVLAVLLLQANRSVSAAELIGQVWGERCPASARSLVHTYIWRLRRLLSDHEPASGQHRIARTLDGYCVRVAEGELDAYVFEQLTAEGLSMLANGKVAKASDILEHALGLWSGESLSDLDIAGAAAAECARLAELRRQVLNARIESDLIRGQHAMVAAELRKLVAEEPLDEKLYIHLMVALSQSGRRADALQVYEEARRHLATELGLEPCVRLRHLQAAILQGDTSLHSLFPAHMYGRQLFSAALPDAACALAGMRPTSRIHLMVRSQCFILIFTDCRAAVPRLYRRATRNASYMYFIGECEAISGSEMVQPWLRVLSGGSQGTDWLKTAKPWQRVELGAA